MAPKKTRGTAAPRQQRRRGQELENALLEAAWDELTTGGYSTMTMEAVAARARTSRAVLYRRWPTKSELAVAAIRHHRDGDPVNVPDSGNLRDDLIALVREAGRHGSDFAVLVNLHLSGYFEETGLTPSDLRSQLLSDRDAWTGIVLPRAIERGEIDPGRLTPRLIALPFDLFRHELLMTFKPIPESVILEIVDEVFLPLVMTPR